MRGFSTKVLVGAFWALGMAAQGYAQADKFLKRSYKTGSGFTLPYRIFIPPGYAKGAPIPMVLALHGRGERGDDNSIQLTSSRLATHWAADSIQSRYPSIVVAPQCPVLVSNWVEEGRTPAAGR